MKMTKMSSVLLYLLLSGCAAPSENAAVTLKRNLQSCVGKLTTTEVLMFASSPTEKVAVNDGEVWIYKYRKTNIVSNATTTGNGSLFSPYQTETISTNEDRTFEIRLRFNRNRILVDWSYNGNYAAFDYPFLQHSCPTAATTTAVAHVMTPTNEHSAVFDSTKEAKKYFESGVYYLSQKNYDFALKQFQAAYNVSPHYMVRYNIGICLWQLHRYTEAEAELQAYLKDGGGNVTADQRVKVQSALFEILQMKRSTQLPDATNSEAEVQQPGTSLYWLRCPLGQTWSGSACTGDTRRMNWNTANIACPPGYRLPTRQEFIDLLDDCSTDVQSGKWGYCKKCDESGTCSRMFTLDTSPWYWSSSPVNVDSTYSISLSDGYIHWYHVTSDNGSVRCVRSGPDQHP